MRGPGPDNLPLGSFRFPAMGCQFEILALGGFTPRLAEAGARAQELVEWIEQTLSVYRPDSEVSRLNQRAGSGFVPVSGMLAALIPICLNWTQETGGAFDFTTGPLAELWGFRDRTPRVPDAEDVRLACQQVGSGFVDWRPEPPAVRFLRPGIGIDFNGIGKGFALGEIGSILRTKGIESALVHGGQSSVLAMGSDIAPAGSEPGCHGALPDGWRIGVADPLVPRRRLAEVVLRDESLATSGSARQVIVRDGIRYGHVLDPRTGWPASHWLSATVIHGDPAVCDVLSTATFVMSPDELEQFASRHPDIGILAARGGTDGEPVTLRTWNLERVDGEASFHRNPKHR